MIELYIAKGMLAQSSDAGRTRPESIAARSIAILKLLGESKGRKMTLGDISNFCKRRNSLMMLERVDYISIATFLLYIYSPTPRW